MGTRTEVDFLEWLSVISIYIGYARYGQINGHGFVCASKYDESETLENLVDNLDGGDIEAIDAGKKIQQMDCWIGTDPDPAKAMQYLMDNVRDYYFNKLNDGKTL